MMTQKNVVTCWNCLRRKDNGAGAKSRAMRVEICASKYYPSLDGVTRRTLFLQNRPSGGGSCLLLGERRI